MTDSRNSAIALAKLGFKVFRTGSTTCRPIKPAYWESASADPATVEAEFTGFDGQSVEENVGIATGEGLLVVDIDVKGGKEGESSLADLRREGLSTDTFTIKTPSGGFHLFYKVDPHAEFKTMVNWRPGVDTRAYHGYVSSLGTVKANGAYSVLRDSPLADLDESLARSLLRGTRAKIDAVQISDAYEDAWSIGKAVEFLQTAEPETCDGNRHHPLIRIGHVLYDLGITPDTAAELVDEHWPFAIEMNEDVRYVLSTLASGRAAEGKAWGCSHPRAQPSAYLELRRVHLARPEDEGPRILSRMSGARKFYRLDDCRIEALGAKEDPLVADLLDKGALSEWYGGSNTGKTFILLSLSRAIAAGEPWAGRKTSKGLVIYFAAEGGTGILKRGAALAEGRDDAATLPLFVVPAPVDLRNGPAGLKALLADVKAIEEIAGEPVALIIIDTLSRVLAGGNENDSADMGKLVQAFTAIQNETRAHVAIAHHTGKNEENGARGHSLMKGAVDTEIYIKRGAKDKVGRIEVTKQRDRELGSDLMFRLDDVFFGPNADGELAKSAVAVVMTATRINGNGEISAAERLALDALDLLSAGDGGAEGVSGAEWDRRVVNIKVGAGEKAPTRQRLSEWRLGLKTKGWIREERPHVWVRT